MEHAFAVLLGAELTTASSNKLYALTQSALKIGPHAVVRILNNHIRQSLTEMLPPALQFAEGLCRNAGPQFKSVFESELPELFEQAWSRSDRAIRAQLLKLYVSWKSSLPQEVIMSIDTKMKTAKTIKREPELQPPQPQPMKRLKADHLRGTYEEVTPTPIPMQTNNPPYWSVDRDPNIIHIDSDEEDSDEEEFQNGSIQTLSLMTLLMKSAEHCKQFPLEENADQVTTRLSTHVDFRNLHIYDEKLYKNLVQGTKATKPKYLDWRFKLRFDRRRQNYQSRAWYAHPEIWAQDSNPKDLSPQQLLQRLSKPRSWKTDDIMRVPIDDTNPQSHCAISGDLLWKTYDEKTGKWHYINCRRLHREDAHANNVADGSVCLIDCIKSSYQT